MPPRLYLSGLTRCTRRLEPERILLKMKHFQSKDLDSTQLEWVPYSFYHDRFRPFEIEGDDLLYVIGLFRNGACERLYPMETQDGCLQLGIAGSDGRHWYGVRARGLNPAIEQTHMVKIINPFDVVAIAKVQLPVSGLSFSSFEGLRSYILIEHPVGTLNDDSYEHRMLMDSSRNFEVCFDPSKDRGEYALRHDQATLLLRNLHGGIYGTPLRFRDGLLEFLDCDISSDTRYGDDCYAAHGIVAESQRHIFVAIAKRSDILAYIEDEAQRHQQSRQKNEEKAKDRRYRKEIEKQLFASSLRFDSTEARHEFDKRNATGALAEFQPEFDAYLANIEQTRFSRGVVSLMAREKGVSLEDAAQATQNELTQYAIKKVIGYAAAAEKALLV